MAENPTENEDVFNVDRIRRLIDLMKEYDLSEVDLKQSEQQIRLVRGSVAPMVAAAPPTSMVSATPLATLASPGDVDGPHISVIKSPMVGTYYTKANPKSEPFVKVGSAVTPETTVCIIEAMKVFNDIPAEIRGTIVAILVENEQPVDFGRPLFKVDTRS
jgi:acetyl-CoA carboxylase biotin carboxyl carrier protein